jgi:CBS domain-containing protein
MWREIRYNLDVETGLPHIFDHGVSTDEVEDVLRRPLENRRGGDDSRVLIGATRAGRVLRVICVPDDDGQGVFVVTAYDVVGKALSAFRRRRRRKPQ